MDAVFYRAEAERCHELAEGSKDPEVATRWRAQSRKFHSLAEELEAPRAADGPTGITETGAGVSASNREPEDRT